MKPTTSEEVPPWEKIPLAKEIPMTKITSIFPSPLKPRPSLIRELADSMERLGPLAIADNEAEVANLGDVDSWMVYFVNNAKTERKPDA
jgi:hypothetical protein